MPKYDVAAKELQERFRHVGKNENGGTDYLPAKLIIAHHDDGKGNVWYLEFTDGFRTNTYFSAPPDREGFKRDTMHKIVRGQSFT